MGMPGRAASWRKSVAVHHAVGRVVPVTAVIAALTLLSACSGARASSTKAVFRPPTSVHARLLVPSQYSPVYKMRTPGTAVSASAVFQETLTSDQEVFTAHRHGYGLAFVQSQTYPVVTTDGGLTWQIDGPFFYISAADGPAFVEQIGSAPPDTVYVWGEAGHVVVSTDGGAHWWSSQFDGVLSMGDEFDVTLKGHVLIVVSSIHPTRTYVSTNGRTWTLTR
jgi:hypothetical protein